MKAAGALARRFAVRKAREAALAAQADCLQAEMLLVQMEKDPQAEQRRACEG